MSTAVHTWSCPACGRRVPLRVETCHCGATRETPPVSSAATTLAREASARRTPAGEVRPAAAVRTAADLWRTLPIDVKALAIAAGLTLAAGLGWLAYAPPARPMPAILGYVDVPRPAPSHERRPPFRMPWWR